MRVPAHAAVQVVNRLGRTLNSLGLPPVRLDDEALLETARQRTQLDDFGTQDFREPLRRLLSSLEHEARLSWLGRILARHDFCALLANRLLLVRDRALYPQIARGHIASPLFVAGLPRTGSTLIHHLLAQDPNNRAVRAWEVLAPSPPPAPTSERTDPRIAAAQRPAYELHRPILPHLQARSSGARWVLKAPTHLWNLEALFGTYPDAFVVQT